MSMKPRRFLAGLLGCTVMVATACGSGGSSKPVAKLTNITVAVPQDPGILAFDSVGIGTYTFTRLLWSGLFRIRADTRSLSQVDPDAAMSWTISPDASVYTFHLRPGIKFSDGSPVTSSDVKTSIQIMLKPQYSESVFISEIKTVDTPDPQTVVITLSHGDSTFWPLIAEIIDIFPAAAIQKAGETAFQQDPTVTSGPYELVKYTKNQEVTLKRNPNYWGKKPPFDTITLKIVPDASSRMEQLLSHAIDAAPIDVAQIAQLSSGLHLVIGAPASVTYIGLRFDQAPTNNLLVRQAMNYAIDRNALVHTFQQGHAVLDNSALSPSMVGATSMAPYTYDPAKARQLLAQYGKPVSFKFDVSSSQINNQLAQALASYWQAVGINVTIVTLDGATFFSKEKGGIAGGGTLDPVFFGAWAGATDPSEIFVNLVAKGGFFGYVQIPAIDAAVAQAEGTSDATIQASAYRTADDTCLQDACWVFLWYPQAIFGEVSALTLKSTTEGIIDFETAQVAK